MGKNHKQIIFNKRDLSAPFKNYLFVVFYRPSGSHGDQNFASGFLEIWTRKRRASARPPGRLLVLVGLLAWPLQADFPESTAETSS